MAGDIEKRITAKMVLDSTGFNSSLQGVNSQLRLSQGELKNASTQVGVFGKDSERLKGVQEALAKQVELHSKKVDIYKESIEKTSTKMQENIKERDKLKASLEQANKAYDEAVKLYGKESEQAQKAKEEVSKLEKEYKNKEKAVESNAKQIQNYENNLNRAEAQMTSAQGELNRINTELERSNNTWIQASESLNKSSEKLKNIGGGMQSAGEGILKLTAPLIGIGVASLKVGMDFESAMSEVQAISGATGQDLVRLEDAAREMGAKTSKSAKDAADGLKYMALAGWDVNKSIAGLEPILRLSEAGNMDLGRASDLVTDSMASLGVQVDELGGYLDKVAQSQSKANTSADQMLEAYVIAGGMFKALNTDLDTSATLINVLANRGIKGSEAGNKLSATLVNLSGSTDKTKSIFKELGIEIYNQEEKYIGIESVLEKLKVKFDGMTEANRNYYMAQLVGKTQIDTMNALLGGLGDEYYNLKEDIINADGALLKMAETMQDNTKGDWIKLMSAAEEVGIQISKVLIPVARDFIGVVGQWVDKFSNLDEETQKNIIKMSAFAVGLGGVLKIGGGMVSTVGGIVGVLGKLSGAFGATQVAAAATASATAGVGTAATVATGAGATGLAGLAAGLGGAVVAAAPFLLAGAAVAGVGYAVYKGMTEEAIPAVDLFADKVETTAIEVEGYANEMGTAYQTTTIAISESTKEAVGAYIELDNSAKESLDNLYINSTTITEDMKNELTTKYTEMGTQINTQMEKDRDENLAGLQEFFNKSSAISQAEESMILMQTQKYYTDKQNVVKGYEEEIKGIIEKASEEKRKLTQEEVSTINDLQQKMKEEAVKILSENEVEAQIILERMKEYDKRITAEQTSEHIKKLNESRDKSVSAAKEEYEKRVATIIKMRDEAKVISKDQAEALIKDAQDQRDGIIKEAENTRIDAIEEMRKMNTDLETQVDTTTGKILNWWDKLKRWWSGWEPESKNFSYNVSGESTSRNGRIEANWTGNRNFQGGLTTLHERGYEVYDLPRGTRIYNHEASEDLVVKTAEAVAKKMSVGSDGDTSINIYGNWIIDSPARQKSVVDELTMKIKGFQRSRGEK